MKVASFFKNMYRHIYYQVYVLFTSISVLLTAKIHSGLSVYHVLSSRIIDAAQSCAVCEHKELLHSRNWCKQQLSHQWMWTTAAEQLKSRACAHLHAQRRGQTRLVERLLPACARVLKWKWNHLPVRVPEVRRPWNSRPHHLLPRWIPCLKLHTLATANALRSPVINWRNWFVWGLPRGRNVFFFSSWAAFSSGPAACW